MHQLPPADGGCGITPHLYVEDASAAIAFYRRVFGAREQRRIPGRGGGVVRAELVIGCARLTLGDADDGTGSPEPRAFGGTAVTLEVGVDDPQAIFARALVAGARALPPVDGAPPAGGRFEDPFGHRWRVTPRPGPLPGAGVRSPGGSIKGAAAGPPP